MWAVYAPPTDGSRRGGKRTSNTTMRLVTFHSIFSSDDAQLRWDPSATLESRVIDCAQRSREAKGLEPLALSVSVFTFAQVSTVSLLFLRYMENTLCVICFMKCSCAIAFASGGAVFFCCNPHLARTLSLYMAGTKGPYFCPFPLRAVLLTCVASLCCNYLWYFKGRYRANLHRFCMGFSRFGRVLLHEKSKCRASSARGGR